MKNASIEPSSVGEALRHLRKARGFSLRELAARSGMAASFLSRVESGKASPTIMSLQKILEALRVSVTDFFRQQEEDPPTEQVVFKHAEMRALTDGERNWLFAFPGAPDIEIELAYEEYSPHTQVSEPECHPNDLCGYVLSGRLTIEIPGRGTVQAHRGDAFYLKANTQHIARNEESHMLRMIVVMTLKNDTQRTGP